MFKFKMLYLKNIFWLLLCLEAVSINIFTNSIFSENIEENDIEYPKINSLRQMPGFLSTELHIDNKTYKLDNIKTMQLHKLKHWPNTKKLATYIKESENAINFKKQHQRSHPLKKSKSIETLMQELDDEKKLCDALECETDEICIIKHKIATCISLNLIVGTTSKADLVTVTEKAESTTPKNFEGDNNAVQPSIVHTYLPPNQNYITTSKDTNNMNCLPCVDFKHSPVCDSQGFTYQNLCVFRYTTCQLIQKFLKNNFGAGKQELNYSSIFSIDEGNDFTRFITHIPTIECTGKCPCRSTTYPPKLISSPLTNYYQRPQLTENLLVNADIPNTYSELLNEIVVEPTEKHHPLNTIRNSETHNNIHVQDKTDIQQRTQWRNQLSPMTELDKKLAKENCSTEKLIEFKERLLKWFDVLNQLEHNTTDSHGENYRKICKSFDLTHQDNDNGYHHVEWMFNMLDLNHDGVLDQSEFRHIETPYISSREPCLKPLLTVICDTNDDSIISSYEWCQCMIKKNVIKPCFEAKKLALITIPIFHKDLTKSHHNFAMKHYIPNCDDQGFFEPAQCHDIFCWCVTPHGLIRNGSKSKFLHGPKFYQCLTLDDREKAEWDKTLLAKHRRRKLEEE